MKSRSYSAETSVCACGTPNVNNVGWRRKVPAQALAANVPDNGSRGIDSMSLAAPRGLS